MAELTTSKVNRQFRTLRSKCVALNNLVLAPSKPTVAITYGHSIRNQPRLHDDTPPLAILQSLDKLTTRLHLDRAIVENLQLSRRIYEVRDAFKNIVQSSSGPSKTVPEDSRRVLPLAGICARLIGEQIQSEINAAIEASPDSEACEDDLRSQTMDELYDNVGEAYRHHTFIAHALTYILETCPHHPTLLNALLEVCVAHNLAPEASTVLRSFFKVAIMSRPNSTSVCPLTHPAHKNFLTSLRETSTIPISTSPSKTDDPSFVVNDRAYTRILVDSLLEPCPEQLYAWTSKAVTKLARELRQQDFAGCFVPLVSGLAFTLAPNQRQQSGKRAAVDTYGKTREEALERLAKWLVSMLDALHTAISTNDGRAEFQACVDFLVNAEQLQYHVVSAPPTSPAECIADALCCLAAYCLASPLASPVPSTDPDSRVLERLLRDAHIRNQTFDGLVSYVFPLPSFTVFRTPLSSASNDTPTPPPTHPTLGDGGIRSVHALAAPLRMRRLLRCEVALYRGALEHVEALISAPQYTMPPSFKLTQKELFDLRLELMDRAEDAERRCYGGALDPSQPPNGDVEWVWEEMVGSWVVKSPATTKVRQKAPLHTNKRRRVETSTAPKERSTRRSTYVPSSLSHSISFISTAPRAPVSQRMALVDRSTARDDQNSSGGEDYDQGTDPLVSGETDTTPAPKRVRKFASIAHGRTNVPSIRRERQSQNVKAKPRASAPAHIFAIPTSPASALTPPRRRANFETLLADSRKNVISLREERARERALAEARDRVAQERRTVAPESDTEADVQVERESSPAPCEVSAEPSSDDALNLFAYPDSSPVKVHRRVRR